MEDSVEIVIEKLLHAAKDGVAKVSELSVFLLQLPSFFKFFC